MVRPDLFVLPRRGVKWTEQGDWLQVPIWSCVGGFRLVQRLGRSSESPRASAKSSKTAVCVLDVAENVALPEFLSCLSDREAWFPTLERAEAVVGAYVLHFTDGLGARACARACEGVLYSLVVDASSFSPQSAEDDEASPRDAAGDVASLWSLAASRARVRELPTCVACLDRLDCFEAWESAMEIKHDEEDVVHKPGCRTCDALVSHIGRECAACGNGDALWACLVCGHVGCGRYSKEHAKLHANATGHSLSIELATRRIWDYTSDSYVHRLGSENAPEVVKGGDSSTSLSSGRGKLHALARHYERILENELANQRAHYEACIKQRLASLDEARDAEARAVDAVAAENAALHAQCAAHLRAIVVARRDNAALLLETDAARATATASTAHVQVLRDVEGPSRIRDFRMQIRDLEVCLRTRASLGANAEAGASLVVPAFEDEKPVRRTPTKRKGKNR